MINYDTIISNFDDKVTLYNWLHKVEEALKNASATNFVVNKKGNATLSFSITFADGEILESGDIVLQQGESVDQARIASGVLQLHLTNGTWLTAGNIKPVSNFSINASQHLIVNYQDDTSQDLGAIFNGNVNIDGVLQATHPKLFETIEDTKGNNRFVKGDVVLGENAPQGMVKTYGKWSLSGSHLMIVFGGELPDGLVIKNGTVFAYAELPRWIFNNLTPLFSIAIDSKTFQLRGNDWSSQDVTVFLNKATGTKVAFNFGNNVTVSGIKNCRFAFDFILAD